VIVLVGELLVPEEGEAEMPDAAPEVDHEYV
jgi:hypothetical protein